MTLVFVSMDYYHDWDIRLYLQSWKHTDRIYLMHSDVRRMVAANMSHDEIKENIRRTIDESDVVLAVSGSHANRVSSDSHVIGTCNWQHYGLEYASERNLIIHGMKLRRGVEIPTPLNKRTDVKWQTLNARRYIALLESLLSNCADSKRTQLQ